jgi:hypothetical protein
MSDNHNEKYSYYRKVAWVIYALLALAIACVLVLFVARDTEERFFYGFMTLASAYVFRPTDKFFSKMIFKYTGVSQPSEKE